MIVAGSSSISSRVVLSILVVSCSIVNIIQYSSMIVVVVVVVVVAVVVVAVAVAAVVVAVVVA